MINHYYTLHHIVENLNIKLRGSQIDECFTQEKDEIIIVFNNNKEINNLCINLSSNEQAIYIKDKFARARSNSYDLFKELIGDTFKKISVQVNDRIIYLRLNKKIIVINLASASEHNLIILNNNFIIENSFKNAKELKSKKYEKKEHILPLPIKENFENIIKLLSNSNLLLPRAIANLVLDKYSLNRNDKLSTISNLDELIKTAELYRLIALNSSEYYLYIFEDNSAFLSLIELKLDDVYKEIRFNDIHQAVSHRVAYKKRSENIKDSKNAIIKKLKSIQSKLIKNIQICHNLIDLENRIEQYKSFAEILLSLPNPNKLYGKEIQCDDWSGNKITIPLDEKMNLIENSNKYYIKIKKIKTDISKRKSMLPKYQKKLEKVNEILTGIENINSIKEIKKFMNSINSDDKRINNAINESESSKFREFDLSDGYTLYVGRNAKNNDELTMKFAKANDIWMHARGSSGSHTVLRGSNPKETKIPKNILQKAAEITAFYSKQKNAKYVPVAYTFKKYVHKPKGANPGAVVMSKETVIMAEPKLPIEN